MRTLDLDGAHILIVDDERDPRDLLRAMLADTGARISEADSATEALRVLRKTDPTSCWPISRCRLRTAIH